MGERMEWLMVVPSFQREFDFDALFASKTDDEWKGGGGGRGDRRCGQVRTTVAVIVPEIILNERGLGSDL